jgi:uncharacterized protein (TIGR00369 family)
MNDQTQNAFDPTAEGWKKMRATSGFSELVGPIWARNHDGVWEYAFFAEAKHDNRQGATHGGMLMTFADHAIGVAAWEAAGRKACVTMQMETQFLKAVRQGDFVECRGEVVRAAKSVIFMRGELRVRGQAVMAASGIWKIVG